MRTFSRLHVLAFLSLGVALSGCDAGEDGSNTNDGTVHDGTGTNPANATFIYAMAPEGISNQGFTLDGNPVDVELCDETMSACEIQVNQADGRTYTVDIDMPGFTTVTHKVRVEDSDIGSSLDAAWGDPGTYGETFDGWCTDQYGNSTQLLTEKITDDDGNEWVVLTGTPLANAAYMTGSDFYGERSGATMSGWVDASNMTAYFQEVYDGETEVLNYTCI